MTIPVIAAVPLFPIILAATGTLVLVGAIAALIETEEDKEARRQTLQRADERRKGAKDALHEVQEQRDNAVREKNIMEQALAAAHAATANVEAELVAARAALAAHGVHG